MGFTKEQQSVIDARNTNILVSAAAGSGKTAVLTERVFSLTCGDPEARRNAAQNGAPDVHEKLTDIDRILIVTFTRAAAAEMRERIRGRISKELEKYPDDEILQRQETLIHRAQITTIDSFCMNVLRNHFGDIGLDPDFRIMDSGEKSLLEEDALATVMERCYAEGGDDFKRCVDFFCPGRSDDAIGGYIKKIYQASESHPYPDEYLSECRENVRIGDEEHFYECGLGGFFAKYLAGEARGVEQTFRVLRDTALLSESLSAYVSTAEADLENAGRLVKSAQLLETVAGSGDKKALADAVASYGRELDIVKDDFGKLPSVRKTGDEADEEREKYRKSRNAAKDKIKEKYKEFFERPLCDLISESDECVTYLQTLIDTVYKYRDEIACRKKDKKMLDFSDIEHLALRILVQKTEDGTVCPDTALEYRDHFDEIMTDEYQDSNLVQEYILSAISRKGNGTENRFMVGDVKQSIYAFRQARPDLFIEKQMTYTDHAPDLRIDLNRNFRSREVITQAVNAVFERMMNPETGEIVYDDKAALYPGAEYPEYDTGGNELLLFESAGKDDEESNFETEARIIAARIKSLMDEGYMVAEDRKPSSPLRHIRFRDIVILMRNIPDEAEKALRKVFEKEDIPLYAEARKGYFDAPEVSDLVNYLRVVSNPLQDIPLFAVMRSRFGGFTDNEIALIRGKDKKRRLWSSLRDAAETDEHAAEFVSRVESYRRLSTYRTVRELTEKMITESDYLEYVSALPAGDRRRANVLMVLGYASDFEKTSYFGLHSFVRYLDQVKKYQADFGEAGVISEDANVVRLMTIHKSKGLEFPVVFIAGLGKQYNMQDVSDRVVIHRRLGIGSQYVDIGRRTKKDTLRRKLISLAIRREQIEEEIRLLYVAFTRAEEKLILVGAKKDCEAAIREIMNRETGSRRLDAGRLMNAVCGNDLLLPVLPLDEIRIGQVTKESLTEDTQRQYEKLSERLNIISESQKYADAELLARLRKKFEYRYAYGYLGKLFSKTSVSELKKAAMEEADEIPPAQIIFGDNAQGSSDENEGNQGSMAGAEKKNRKDSSATDRGDAYHRCMELLDFDRVLGPSLVTPPADYEEYREKVVASEEPIISEMKKFIEEEKESLRLREDYVRYIDTADIFEFLKSELSYRMWKAYRCGKLRREQPFVFKIPASRVIKDDDPQMEKESVLIQGIIDAYFEENEEIVILDYKTDRVKAHDELVRRYKVQLEYYKEALSALTHLPVRECRLYSFKLGAEIPVMM